MLRCQGPGVFCKTAKKEPRQCGKQNPAITWSGTDIAQKCYQCSQDTLDLVPDLRAANEEERIKEDASRDRRVNPFPGMSHIASTLPSTHGSLPGSGNRSQAPSGASGEVMIVQDRTSAWGGPSVVRSSSPTNSTVSSFHPRSTSEYSTPLTGSIHSSGTTKGGFHKQGAYKPSAYERAMSQLQREDLLKQEAQAARTRDDDDDNDSEWEM